MKIGDIVYLYYPGRFGDNAVVPYEVLSVHDKLIKISKPFNGEIKRRKTELFNIETRHSIHFYPNAKLYFSREELKDDLTYDTLKEEMTRVFRWDSKVKLSLDQLQRIKNIIQEEGKKDAVSMPDLQ